MTDFFAMVSLRWQHLNIYLELMRVDRPIGTYLVLWPALWALFFASPGLPDLKLLIVFTLGAFLMRSAGCVINDYADRGWDSEVNRTQDRPLASGRMSEKEAIELFILLIAVAGCLLLFLDNLTRLWSLGAIALASLYPFAKRATHLPQVVLGAAFAWSIPMAFVATQGSTNTLTWLLFCIVIIWVVFYDTFYAMVDREDDLKVGIKSTAILFGDQDRLITGILQLIFLFLLAYLGMLAKMKFFFFLGLFAAGMLLLYQQFLIRNRNPERCFRAFLNNNYVGLAVFLGILAEKLVDKSPLITAVF